MLSVVTQRMLFYIYISRPLRAMQSIHECRTSVRHFCVHVHGRRELAAVRTGAGTQKEAQPHSCIDCSRTLREEAAAGGLIRPLR